MDFLLIIGALGALLIRVGFAVHGAGMARSKNSAGAVMRHLCDCCVALLAFWAIGHAIASSDARFFGLRWRSLLGSADAGNIYFPAAAVLIATGIVPGVLAERARFWPSLATSLLLAGLLIPVILLWTHAGGWLNRLGFTDHAGAAWLHLPGALAAAVGAFFVAARTGKFNRDGSSTAIPGHSVPLAGIGVMLLLAGFFCFVPIADAAHFGAAAMNLLLAAAAGGLASVMLGQFRYYKPDIHLTCAGIVGAMVAISAAAGTVPGIAAVLIGAVAGIIVPLAILSLDVHLRIDDPSGNIAIHGIGAVWGLIAAPLLARGLTITDRLKGLGIQLLGIAAITLLTIALATLCWLCLKRLTKLRVSEADEFDGLDLAEHDIGAYPDFQQNTIKSYHLREV
ncbi:MAG: ammonium transporter [Phycisphaerales bacterium]|nr:ammonium transporter [Phycisphaerales bacterium]